MMTWAIFSSEFEAGAQQSHLAVQWAGGPNMVAVRPADAWLAMREGRLVFGVAHEGAWKDLCGAAKDGASYPLFTTAPASLLTQWFSEGQLHLNHFGNHGTSHITIRRAEAPVFTGKGAGDCYGPYWRRFLHASSVVPGLAGGPAAVPVVEGGQPEGESWAVYCRPQEIVASNPTLVENANREGLLRSRHAVVLPPWETGPQTGDDYHAINQGGTSGRQTRMLMREAVGRREHAAGEPALITLWRAMDDAALRPEMLRGAQIELGGIPCEQGVEGEPTRPRLLLPPAAEDDGTTLYRHDFLLNGRGLSPMIQKVREALLSDLREVFGLAETTMMEAAVQPLGRVPLPDCNDLPFQRYDGTPIQRLLRTLEKAAGAGLHGFENSHQMMGAFSEPQAVRKFWTRHLHAPSWQIFVDPGWWERVPFLEEGCLHELCEREPRSVADRFQAAGARQGSYFHVADLERDDGCLVEVCPETDESSRGALMHAALLVPLGARLLWGGGLVLDYDRCELDGGFQLL